MRTTFDFRALADLAGAGSGVVGDEQLAANLSAQRVDVAGLDAALTAQLREALRMRVAVALAGRGNPRVATRAGNPNRARDRAPSQLDVRRIAWLGAGVILGAARWQCTRRWAQAPAARGAAPSSLDVRCHRIHDRISP